jgi:hypothetical protein
MPRLATTSNINNPKRYGYDVRVDNILLRSAVGPGREMTIQSSDVQEQQINVKQNPEDFTSNLGRIYSRNNFSGGQGLDTAHRSNGTAKDVNRFWDSKGLDVFHGDDETSYHIHLLYSTEEKTSALTLNGTNNYLVRTYNDTTLTEYLWLVDGTKVYVSSNGGTSWSLSVTASYVITGIATFGKELFITAGAGTNKQLQHYDGSTWSIEALGTTLTGFLNGVWVVKGTLYISGQTTAGIHYLWYADPVAKNYNNTLTTSSSEIVVGGETNLFTSMVDAGSVVLATNESGNIYSIKDTATGPELKGQTQIPFEEIHTIAAAEGIVFFGTKEFTRDVGRFYRADLVVADDLYVLANRQLIKEWVIDSVDTTPHSMFVSRDSVYVGVEEDGSKSYLWRYYLPTAGLARDLEFDAGGYIYGITQSEGKFVVSVVGAGVYKETSSYVSTGYLIMSAADFFTAEHKQFVGAETSTFTMANNSSIELYYSTKFEALDNPSDISFKLALTQATGVGDEEKQISEVSRYIVGKVVLKSEGDYSTTPKLKSVQFRALARPELVVAQIPINISDRVERPGRKPIKVKGLGNTLYNALREKEGDSVTLELFDPVEIIRGVVERISYPININVERGSVTQYAIITVRGTRQPTISDVTSVHVFGINALGFIRFGA